MFEATGLRVECVKILEQKKQALAQAGCARRTNGTDMGDTYIFIEIYRTLSVLHNLGLTRRLITARMC